MSSTTEAADISIDRSGSTGTEGTEPLRAAKAPVGTGLTPVFGQLIALLLIALGVLGVQEALARSGVVTTSWTAWLLDRASGLSASFSLLVLFVALALVGLALLVAVFKPRPSKTLTLSSATGVFLRTGDLARIVQSRVDGADGVADVDATARRRKLSVTVSTVEPTSGNAELERDVQARLRPTLDALDNAPRVTVSITNQELA